MRAFDAPIAPLDAASGQQPRGAEFHAMRLLLGLFLTVATSLGGQAVAGDAKEGSEIIAILTAARSADRIWQQQLTTLYTKMEDPAEEQRLAAISQLAEMGDRGAVVHILTMLDATKHTPAELKAACHALVDLHAVGAIELMRRLTTHPDAEVRLVAVTSIDRLGNPAEWKPRITDSAPAISSNAVINEGILGAGESAVLLAEQLRKHRDPLVRRLCAFGLGRLGSVAQADALIAGLIDANLEVRRTCAEALTLLKHTPAVPYLIRVLEIGNDYKILAALTKLSKQDFGYDPSTNLIQRTEAIAKADRWWGAQQAAP